MDVRISIETIFEDGEVRRHEPHRVSRRLINNGRVTVDPTVRTLEAFALKNDAWVLISALHDDAEVRVAPFDAVRFALGALWAD